MSGTFESPGYVDLRPVRQTCHKLCVHSGSWNRLTTLQSRAFLIGGAKKWHRTRLCLHVSSCVYSCMYRGTSPIRKCPPPRTPLGPQAQVYGPGTFLPSPWSLRPSCRAPARARSPPNSLALPGVGLKLRVWGSCLSTLPSKPACTSCFGLQSWKFGVWS